MFVVFTTSLILIALMISVKVFEEKKGKKTFLTKKLSSFDNLILNKFFEIKKKIIVFFNKVKIFILKQIISYLRSFFGSVKSHIDEKYIEFHGNLRGKKIIKNKETSSFYLKDINEYKNNNYKDVE